MKKISRRSFLLNAGVTVGATSAALAVPSLISQAGHKKIYDGKKLNVALVGLGNYAGATDLNSLITEILRQRRYSLFGEGHRWIDLRRYNQLAILPIDRAGDDVWTQFPRPVND